MKKITLILFIFSSFFSFSQDLWMQNGTFNQCSGVFYDSGGPGGNYSSNEDYVLTICPENIGDIIELDFTTFNTQRTDFLTIYNGNSDAAPVLDTHSGGPTNSPGLVQATIDNGSGCLTFKWSSDSSGITTGWAADISCFTPCQTITGSIDSTVPAFDVSNIIVAELDEVVSFTGSANMLFPDPGATYIWDFGDGSTAEGTSASHAFSTAGVYTVSLVVTDTNPLGCSSEPVSVVVQVGASGPGNPSIDAGRDVTIPCDEDSIEITAKFLDIGETNTYTISEIPFVPPFPFNGLSNSMNTGVDDRWSSVGDLPFDFCFFTNVETQFQVGSNGVIRFDVDPNDISNAWQFNENLPNNTTAALSEANIFTPAHDIDPEYLGTRTEIAWEIIGVEPNRVLAVSFYNVAMFNPIGGNCRDMIATHMAVLYETTNVIDIYIKDSPTCSWNNYSAVVGIQNNAGTQAFVPPGRNTSNSPWTATNEAWRFTPAGDSVTEFAWLDAAGDVIGTDPTMTVSPTEETTYTARVIYTNCNGDEVTVTDNVTVSVDIPFELDAGPDLEFCEGDADAVINADIGSDTATYEWYLDGFIIEGETSSSLTVISGASGVYTVSVTDDICTISEDVVVTYHDIPVANELTEYRLCDDTVIDGFTEFDLSTKSADVIGTQTDVNLSYHVSQADADTNENPLDDLFTNTVNPQTIFVRLENTNLQSCFDTTTLVLNVDSGIELVEPENLVLCASDGATDTAEFDLESQTAIMLDGLTDVTISYHASVNDANYNLDPLPANYTNTSSPQIIYVRAENDLETLCFTTTTFELIVHPLPVTITPTSLKVCDDSVSDGITNIDLSLKNIEISGGAPNVSVSYYLSLADAESATDALPIPIYRNTSNGQIVYVRVENANTGCYDTTELVLEVIEAPETFAPDDLEYCDPDNDGHGVFMLTDRDDQITGGVAGVSVTYHETLTNAETNANPLPSPYETINENSTIVYARVESANVATDCYIIEPLKLVVNPTPQFEAPSPIYACVDAGAAGFYTQFNLGDKAEELLELAELDPTLFSVSFYADQANANTGTNPFVTPNNFTNTTAFNQVIWVRVTDVGTGCYKVKPLELIVNTNPEVVQPEPLNICDDETRDYMTSFDLTVKNSEITDGNPNWSVQYYTTNANAQADESAIDPVTDYINVDELGAAINPQTLFVRVTDPSTGCFSFTTLTIRVQPNPLPRLNPSALELCDDTDPGSGQTVFDLTVNEDYIINGETGMTATYYETLLNAEDAVNPILTPEAYTNTNTNFGPQTIYVRVTNDLTGCYAIVSFTITVNPLPEAGPVSDYIICELNNDGIASFNLQTKNEEALNGQDPALFTVTYHFSEVDADAVTNSIVTPFFNSVNPQEIFVAITNNTTGCSVSTESFFVEVQEGAMAYIPDTYVICDNIGANDGYAQFDLSVLDPEVLGNQDPENYMTSYYFSEADAILGENPLPTLYENLTNPQVIYVRVDNDTPTADGADSSICFDVAPISLQVDLLPIYDLADTYVLCEDLNGSEAIGPLVIDTELSADDYSFVWSFNGEVIAGQTAGSLEISEAGLYEVIVTNLTTGCSLIDSTEVSISTPPSSLQAVVASEAFGSENVIEAEALGSGVYEYSLDNGPWQDSGTFTGVSMGAHTVTARDVNGCGLLSVTVTIMDYPKFFTPNGDGYNDTWNIVGLSDQPSAKIYIFDRFGKLLKQISPAGTGWDGTFNGELMPTSDYWFTVEYDEPITGDRKEFKAHFTLKR